MRDQRPKGRNNEPPLPEKIVLRPTAESINHDVKTNARENRWGDKEALELESRLLVRPYSAHEKLYLKGPLARYQRATYPGSRSQCESHGKYHCKSCRVPEKGVPQTKGF